MENITWDGSNVFIIDLDPGAGMYDNDQNIESILEGIYFFIFGREVSDSEPL